MPVGVVVVVGHDGVVVVVIGHDGVVVVVIGHDGVVVVVAVFGVGVRGDC